MPKDCCKRMWDNVKPDEPVFTLRGTDPLAAKVTAYWNTLAIEAGVNPDKIKRGVEHQRDFEQFSILHPDRMKLPD